MDNLEETININSYNSNRLKNDLEQTILFNNKTNNYINENKFIECMIELGFKYKRNGNQYKFNCKYKILKCEICDVEYKCGKIGIYNHQQNIKHKRFLKNKNN